MPTLPRPIRDYSSITYIRLLRNSLTSLGFIKLVGKEYFKTFQVL